MIYIGMIEEALTMDLNVVPLTMTLHAKLERALAGASSEWARRMTREKRALLESLMGAKVIVEAPWGIIYVDEYEPRWKLSGHGIFWGREVVRAEGAFRVIARALFHGSDVRRIEIPLLGPARGVGRVLAGAGFTFEGTLRKGGIDASGVVTDKAIWSILREEVTQDGK